MVEKKLMTFQERLGQALVEGGFVTLEQLNQVRHVAEAGGKKLTGVLQERDSSPEGSHHCFKLPAQSANCQSKTSYDR